ncbi:MAG: hypothetical protein AVDCRST_MAG32-2504 [uncultured Nocardioides sp.]|uniref:Uncharacterized protein n=1 Tax=uncultured Nocardioides sp. TaxID=198441 RepID=A0A6J4NPD7_9ACTN|nr:MAG: hypothetical protein AVDCRST_MAG32-2504 [uncultured Nocardioides sp.]
MDEGLAPDCWSPRRPTSERTEEGGPLGLALDPADLTIRHWRLPCGPLWTTVRDGQHAHTVNASIRVARARRVVASIREFKPGTHRHLAVACSSRCTQSNASRTSGELSPHGRGGHRAGDRADQRVAHGPGHPGRDRLCGPDGRA